MTQAMSCSLYRGNGKAYLKDDHKIVIADFLTNLFAVISQFSLNPHQRKNPKRFFKINFVNMWMSRTSKLFFNLVSFDILSLCSLLIYNINIVPWIPICKLESWVYPHTLAHDSTPLKNRLWAISGFHSTSSLLLLLLFLYNFILFLLSS